MLGRTSVPSSMLGEQSGNYRAFRHGARWTELGKDACRSVDFLADRSTAARRRAAPIESVRGGDRSSIVITTTGRR